MVLLIAYDLHQPHRRTEDYAEVIEKIESFGSSVHDEKSVWLVDTTKTPDQCCDELEQTRPDAAFFVARITRDCASANLDSEVADWLANPLREW